MEMLRDPEFWVGVGTLIFLGILLWQKVPAVVTKALDARAAVDRLRNENAALQEQVDALAAERLLLGDRAFLELLARGYGLGSPLEHPFALSADAPALPLDAPGSATRRLATPQVEQAPLDRWLEIIFGG